MHASPLSGWLSGYQTRTANGGAGKKVDEITCDAHDTQPSGLKRGASPMVHRRFAGATPIWRGTTPAGFSAEGM
jgi:hypothetical protein